MTRTSSVMQDLAATRREDPSLLSLLDRVASDEWLRSNLGDDASVVARRHWEQALHRHARELMSRPGKRVRARLVEAGWMLAGGDPEKLPSDLPSIVELLHLGSLIVDDIEDDSPRRRGGPALHRQAGLPLALNTGNWLYFLPLALMDALPLSPMVIRALHKHSTAALLRCHYGQGLDLSVRVHSLDPSELPSMVRAITALKTGSLGALAVLLGSVAAGARDEQARACGEVGRELAVGLQMLDDLAAVRVPSRIDKGLEDVRYGRATWPWAWLVEGRPERVWRPLLRLQRSVLERGMDPAVVVTALGTEIGELGRAATLSHLEEALATAERRTGTHPATDLLRRESERLVCAFLPA